MVSLASRASAQAVASAVASEMEASPPRVAERRREWSGERGVALSRRQVSGEEGNGYAEEFAKEEGAKEEGLGGCALVTLLIVDLKLLLVTLLLCFKAGWLAAAGVDLQPLLSFAASHTAHTLTLAVDACASVLPHNDESRALRDRLHALLSRLEAELPSLPDAAGQQVYAVFAVMAIVISVVVVALPVCLAGEGTKAGRKGVSLL